MKYAIVTHGGAGSPESHSDGCTAAAEAARAALEAGKDAMEAAIRATVVLEDDPRFNAGTGSNLRLDGKLIQMDAALMSSDGKFGAVGCIEKVKNPILVAAKVTTLPHLMLVGKGATAFGRRHGFGEYDPETPQARAKYEKARKLLKAKGRHDEEHSFDLTTWQRITLEQVWNFEGAPPDCDTVGAVVRDVHGRFAATASTGGTTYALRGRVGDSPIMGAGVYAGPFGAVAATGVGEEIVKRFLSKTVYDWLAQGMAPARAAQRGITMFPDVVPVGLLVVGREGHAVISNRNMASGFILG